MLNQNTWDRVVAKSINLVQDTILNSGADFIPPMACIVPTVNPITGAPLVDLKVGWIMLPQNIPVNTATLTGFAGMLPEILRQAKCEGLIGMLHVLDANITEPADEAQNNQELYLKYKSDPATKSYLRVAILHREFGRATKYFRVDSQAGIICSFIEVDGPSVAGATKLYSLYEDAFAAGVASVNG